MTSYKKVVIGLLIAVILWPIISRIYETYDDYVKSFFVERIWKL